MTRAGLRMAAIQEPGRLNLNLEAPLVFITAERDGLIECLVGLDIEREARWGSASFAREINDWCDRLMSAGGKRPRGVEIDYSDEPPGADRAICLSVGDAWASDCVDGMSAYKIALWSLGQELCSRRVDFIRLPDAFAQLARSPDTVVDGFLCPHSLAERGRSIFLPFLEALCLEAHTSRAASSGPRRSI